MSSHGPAPAPCRSCPYRRDVPSGLWAEDEYEKLPAYDNETPFQPVGAFFCHQQNGRLCAGWVGCHDMGESLGLRLASSRELLTPEDVTAALDYVSPVPLWGSGAQAAEHGMQEINNPDAKARRAIDRLKLRQQRMLTIEARILDALDTDEGTEMFNLPASPRQASAALQRLRKKGLAEAAHCPDGAWVWFRIDQREGD